jgi:riboflavin kinase/FMN adenylyltransferase
VTFEPLPQAFFRPENAPARLASVYQKLERLTDAGADLCWMMRFDNELAKLSPVDFVKQVLVEGLSARYIVVGEDFRFGHKRAGDLEQLTKLGRQYDFDVEAMPAVLGDGERISSTAIRQALAAGDFAQAGKILGRPYEMQGHVVRGQQLGRTLGFPTANLRVPVLPSPVNGIFAVYARDGDRDESKPWRAGVASLGWRPTVGGKDLLLEVHLFDFTGDLYGRRLRVEFVAKLRDELHFSNVDEMVDQMKLDAQQARQILAEYKGPGSPPTGLD